MDTDVRPTESLSPEEPRRTAGEPAPGSDSGLPSEFGDYLLLEEIGRGGMGVVYKARQRRLQRIVAIKIILAGSRASADQVRRFRLEARAAAGIVHPNVVRIFDAGEVLGQPFFAMEYVAGESLAERLRAGILPYRETATLLRAVAGAVAHLHRAGVIHRDLKPGNILLDAGGDPYVTDFGLAKLFGEDSLTRTCVIAGTPWYMSPEQAAGKVAELDARSDIYSLGAILYELLTGRPPHVAESPMDTLLQVIEREPESPRERNPRVPRDLEMICLKCLSKSPMDRYPGAEALAEDLDRFLAGEPVAARPPGPLRRLARWARRNPPLALRLAGIALFYGVELANYHVAGVVGREWHYRISIDLAAWALASVVLQRYARRARWETAAVFAWGLVDIGIVTRILFLADGAVSSLIVAYPLLVVASGLWLRTTFVWFMTAAATSSYAFLVADFYLRRPELQAVFRGGFDRHVFFVLMLLLIGSMVTHQVGRARALGAYYASRRPAGTKPPA